MILPYAVVEHPESYQETVVWAGWSWYGFLFGPLLLFARKLWFHAFALLAITIMTGGLAGPIVWFICGAYANRWHRHKLFKEGYAYKEILRENKVPKREQRRVRKQLE